MSGLSTTRLRQWRESHPLFLRRLFAIIFVLAIAFSARGLTARFIREHLTDASWFQYGSYALFDRQAQNILDGKASVFWIDDPSQTEAAVYPPGYPIWLALVYTASGNRSAYATQSVQWILDALAVLLIVGVATTAYKWTTGIVAGVFAALAPLLSLAGASPTADAPTNWLVLAGVWLLLVAYKRQSVFLALGAGAAVGLSCWFRANGLALIAFWAIALLLISRSNWRSRLLFAAAPVLGALILVAPLFVRNAIAFHAFVPTGLGFGTNLWEGLGETDRAAEFGAVYGDAALIEQERVALGVAAGAPFTLYYPNGVERDRARARKSLKIIAQNPVWYAGVMLRRMAGMLKYVGEPVPGMGSAGINVTSEKTLPVSLRGGMLAFAVTTLGWPQSVLRTILLPLSLVGLGFALRREQRFTALLLSTVLYYLLSLSFMHSELRYGLPMHSLLLVWAAFAVVEMRSYLIGRRHAK